jgi:hypothetical protein
MVSKSRIQSKDRTNRMRRDYSRRYLSEDPQAVTGLLVNLRRVWNTTRKLKVVIVN